MAKIRINGDTSGYIEISAPAVAGSTSITLPATTGGSLLATDANGNLNVDSGVLYVDGVNNLVGVGTTSPGNTFAVNGAGISLNATNGNSLLIYRSGTGTDEASINLFDASSNRVKISNSGGNLWFGTAGATERARFDTSGRFLLGTSTARSTGSGSGMDLQIEGAPSPSNIGAVRNSNNAFPARVALAKTRGTSVGSNTIVQSGDSLGLLEFDGADGTQLVQGAGIEAFVDGTPGTNDMPTRLVFSTTADGASSPTERMRIRNDGAVIAVGALADRLNAFSTASAGNIYSLFTGWHSATTGGVSGTLSFNVTSNGNVTNTNGSYTTISDAKLKENIVDAGSQWDDLKAIRIRNWNFKAETGHETHRQIGPIAQELETVCPGLVFETPDRDEDGNETGEVTKGVNQSVLYMKAVKALQEAIGRIESLEAEVAALKAQ